jgi:hypothetical protein
MHRSKLPLTTWFWAAHLMATHSNWMSARQFEDQLGLTYTTRQLGFDAKIAAIHGRSKPRTSTSKSIRRKFHSGSAILSSSLATLEKSSSQARSK